MMYSVGNKEDNWLKVHFLSYRPFLLLLLVLFISSNFRFLTKNSDGNVSIPFIDNSFLYVNVICTLVATSIYLPTFCIVRQWSLLYCCLFDSENQTIEFRYYFLGLKRIISVPISSVHFIESCRKIPLSDTKLEVQKIYINNKLFFVVSRLNKEIYQFLRHSSPLNKEKYDVLRHLLQKFCTKKEEPYW